MFLSGATGISGSHIRLTRGVRPRLVGKEKTPLSSRLATGMSWSPLSDQKGVDREQLEYDRPQAEDDMEFAMRERDLIAMDQEQEMDARIIAARNEELAAYSDFIASLDDK